MGDERYQAHLERRAAMYRNRALEVEHAFADIEGISAQKPEGAFYVTAVFDPARLIPKRHLTIKNLELATYIDAESAGLPDDKRFTYELLASTGICVVPLSGFASNLPGFRFTLLEHDDAKRQEVFKAIADSCKAYVESSVVA